MAKTLNGWKRITEANRQRIAELKDANKLLLRYIEVVEKVAVISIGADRPEVRDLLKLKKRCFRKLEKIRRPVGRPRNANSDATNGSHP